MIIIPYPASNLSAPSSSSYSSPSLHLPISYSYLSHHPSLPLPLSSPPSLVLSLDPCPTPYPILLLSSHQVSSNSNVRNYMIISTIMPSPVAASCNMDSAPSASLTPSLIGLRLVRNWESIMSK